MAQWPPSHLLQVSVGWSGSPVLREMPLQLWNPRASRPGFTLVRTFSNVQNVGFLSGKLGICSPISGIFPWYHSHFHWENDEDPTAGWGSTWDSELGWVRPIPWSLAWVSFGCLSVERSPSKTPPLSWKKMDHTGLSNGQQSKWVFVDQRWTWCFDLPFWDWPLNLLQSDPSTETRI